MLHVNENASCILIHLVQVGEDASLSLEDRKTFLHLYPARSRMGVRAFQQATLMGGSMLAGSASGLGPEAGMMLYHTLSSMNKIFDSNNHQSPTDIAAAEGVAVVNDVLFNHGDVEAAASRIKKLRRGSLDAVAGVNDQVIAAFSKGLKTSNSIEQARTSSAAAYRSTFGGV